MEIRTRNVNGALRAGIELFRQGGVERTVRGSTTLEWGDPVITFYQRPCERVLLCPERDANPFFHLFEALWMLAGRNDVGFVAHMVKRMASFSDNGNMMQGAYGWRWRRAFGVDQIATVVDLLKRDLFTRRAVISMWSVPHDLQPFAVDAKPKVKNQLFAAKHLSVTEKVGGLESKDIPCNTTLYFKTRDGKLDLTICCRSNDVVWGAYGANAVHFSMLLEYIANKVGVKVGRMIQVSDSFHVYTSGGSAPVWDKLKSLQAIEDPYADGWDTFPLGANQAWDDDMGLFFDAFDQSFAPEDFEYKTAWWNGVAIPMWRAWATRSSKELFSKCEAEDWTEAGIAWITRHPEAK